MRKSERKFTLTKVTLSLLAIGAIGSTAQAQWAVTNVNDPLYFGPTGLFTQLMGQMTNSAKAATDQNSALAEVSRKQAIQLQEDKDQRDRLRAGQLEVAKKISAIRPTLEQCAVYTKNAAKAESSKTTSAGAGAAGKISTPTADKGRIPTIREAVQNSNTLLDGPKTEAEAPAILVTTKKSLGTCTAAEIAAGYESCKGASAGDFSGNKSLPASDISPLSLFGNTNIKEKQPAGTDGDTGEYANRSIPTDSVNSVAVSKAYIHNLLMTSMPVKPTAKMMKEKPELEAHYRMLQLRLESSQKALRDILSLTIAPKTANADDSPAGKYWAKNKDKYKNLLGMTPPAIPSMRDNLLFQTTNDYLGVPDQTAMSGDDLLRQVSERQAVSNYISFRQLEALENINIQLAVISMNQIAPFNSNKYELKHNETVTSLTKTTGAD